ncbi:hypothetical protein ABPG72_016556 [Tetrahymena utriculariae]
MNKIVNKKTDLKNQQRSNYHQQPNVKLREGSSSVQTRRRQISSVFTNSSTSQNSRSSYETISKSRSQNSRQRNHSSKSRSTTPLKSVKQRKPTPLPKKQIQHGFQPCKFWMAGRCNKFEQCKNRHYQMSQILYKQNKMENKIDLINQEQTNNQKILVKVEQTTLITMAELMEITQKRPEGLSTAIKISYKNKKALNKLKNMLNKNQKDPYSNNEQKNAREKEILIELLKNTQIDNKNKNALNIKEKQERKKKEIQEKALILKNKPKIILIKETEEKQVQNQQLNQQKQYEKIQQEIQESDEKSDDEIDMTNYNQNKQKYSNNITKDNNTQINNQFNQINQSSNNNESQIKQNKQQTSSETNKYTEILNSPSQQDQSSEAQNFSNQIPSTLMSPTYIQEKDQQKTDKQKFIQNQMKELFGDEIQQDMKWSQNIKSNYMQWKQTRDGKNQSNIHPNSEEPTKQSPLNSIEQQEVIEQSKMKMLYDWKMIYKSKAYRNDTLQNFISYQHPKLHFYENLKVFNLATDYLNKETFTEQFYKYITEIEKLKIEMQAKGILNIFYNKALLDKSLEEYTDTELSEHFFDATESPEKSHIFKMAHIIDRYIKNLVQQSLETKIKNSESQKVTLSEDQEVDNQFAITDALRHIILQNDTNPYIMNYISDLGIIIVTFFSHHSIDWQKVYISQNKQ